MLSVHMHEDISFEEQWLKELQRYYDSVDPREELSGIIEQTLGISPPLDFKMSFHQLLPNFEIWNDDGVWEVDGFIGNNESRKNFDYGNSEHIGIFLKALKEKKAEYDNR